MQKYNYSSVIEDHLKTLTDDEFVSLCYRLLLKLNPDIPDCGEPINLLSSDGLLIDSVLYRAVPVQPKSSIKIGSLIPNGKNKFSFLTILTNKLEFFNQSNRNKLNKASPEIIFNFWGPSEITDKILSFEFEDIKYILDNSSLLTSYLQIANNEERNRQILDKIFDFLFDTPIPDDFKSPPEDNSKLLKID